MSWQLKRTEQCAKCPWRVDVDPLEIPGCYTVEKHRALAGTIAASVLLQVSLDNPELRIMACHESDPSEGMHCVGWLMNQIGPGNNIWLRVSARDCDNWQELRTHGDQHQTFAETLPKGA